MGEKHTNYKRCAFSFNEDSSFCIRGKEKYHYHHQKKEDEHGKS